eukprot:6162096-Amphidinium_carterae.1
MPGWPGQVPGNMGSGGGYPEAPPPPPPGFPGSLYTPPAGGPHHKVTLKRDRYKLPKLNLPKN